MKKPALELGSLIHAALAEWTIDADGNNDVTIYRDDVPVEVPIMSMGLKEDSVPEKYFKFFSNERIAAVQRDYREMVGAPISPEEIAPLYESIALGCAMIKNYKEKWKRPLPGNFIFAKPEQEIIVDIPGTEHRCQACFDIAYKNDTITVMSKSIGAESGGSLRFTVRPNCEDCHGTGKVSHQLRAILDGLIQDTNEVYMVLERKTFSPRYRPTMEGLGRMDQFMGYVWVAKQLGVPKLGGVAYDGLCKLAKPPKGKDLDHLFVRTPVTYNMDQINDWGVHLAEVVNEMANNPVIYPNRPWSGCDDCPFTKLCDAESRGEDTDSIIRNFYMERTR